MALVILDRVKETTTTAGAGTITLLGAATGFQAFSAVGNANTTYYCIASQTLNEWEVGVGTYTLSGTTLARTQILASSNSGSVVTFSAGTKDVFVTYPAGYSVSQADTGTAPNQIPLNQYLGTMAFQDQSAVNIQGGTLNNMLVVSPALSTGYQAATLNRPSTKPSLLLDFAYTRKLDPRITFTRASIGTYYDSYTSAVAEQNLSLYSQDFDTVTNGWTVAGGTATANNTTAPDGTSTAEKFTEDSASSTHRFLQSAGNRAATASGTTYTFSVYLKYIGRQYIQLNLSAFKSTSRVIFDIQNGTVSDASTATASIVSVGSSWYRCIATVVADQTGSGPQITIGGNSTSTGNGETYTGSGTDAFYVWGFQIEIRAAVTAYTPTTTVAITNYIPVLQTAASGIARFDNNPTTRESLGLLIEESRTNLLTYSSDFTNAAWTKAAATITTAADVAPDGTQTAQLFIPDSTSAFHYALGGTMTVSSTYTSSCYMKYAGQQYGHVFLSQAGNNGGTFDLINGTAVITGTGNTGGMTLVGNGWYRCFVTQTSVQLTYTRIGTGAVNAASTGNGYSGIYIWGAQLEAGAFATSYIPTVASTVTRAADSASMTGTNFSSWYNVAQGTMYGEVVTGNTSAISGGQPYFVGAIRSDTSNAIAMGFDSVSANWNQVYVGGVNVVNIGAPATANSTNKIAFAFATNNFAVSSNGASVLTDTSGAMPTVSALYLGENRVTTKATLWVKRFTYFPVALTSIELQGLTS